MCWNAPVSLATFITSTVMCAYLWKRNIINDKPLACFIFWFSLMQLFEFFMWRNMKNHSLMSKLSLVSVLLQPLVLCVSLYYFQPFQYKKIWEKSVLLFNVVASFIKASAATFYAFVKNAKTNWLSVKGPHCHLVWWFIRNKQLLPRIAQADLLYVLMLVFSCALLKPFFNQGLFYFLFAGITCLLTLKFYPLENGSLWCWIANLMGIFAIAMPYVKL